MANNLIPTATVNMTVWLCRIQGRYTNSIYEVMKTKDEFIKYLKQTNKVMYRANNVMYRELQLRIQDKEKIICDKEKMIRDKEKRIQELKVEIMSVKGLLHCRGLLEELLRELHLEKGIEAEFNATQMCGMIAGENMKKSWWMQQKK